MNEAILDKLKILAGSAKYDVSCSSSGVQRNNNSKSSLGNTAAWGICHSFTEDGRCVSLLKILMTNYCIYDCAYCINRRSNDIPRTGLRVEEVVELTIEFYRRNYIEGLFLSSGVIKNPDYTMARMAEIAKKLRVDHRFNGYIHLKTIPDASPELIRLAGLYADRLSVNMEIPSEENLKLLAPEKNIQSILQPMRDIKAGIVANTDERKHFKRAPRFVPAGQSTQLIVGASADSDMQVLKVSSWLYKNQELKRVYYSGYIAVNAYDKRLPVAVTAPPLLRENRLYQADWLMRFYHFSAAELVSDQNPNLDLELDPKLSYALRNPHLFPVDVNTADYEMILRIPGVGFRSAMQIVLARQHQRLSSEHLQKMGVAMKRAQYFITCRELSMHSTIHELSPAVVRQRLLVTPASVKRQRIDARQYSLFGDDHFA